MIERPTVKWRNAVSTQEAEVAAGTLAPDKAYAAELWPADFTAAVDAALEAYEREVRNLPATTDEAIWAAVERVVVALNDADEEGDIETEEREDLAGYIDQVLNAAGIDVAGLTARRGIDRSELTDAWRDW